MTANSARLNESLPNSTGLVGSFYSGNRSQLHDEVGHCHICNEQLMPQSKFCGDCGSPTNVADNNISSTSLSTHVPQVQSVPAFAQVSPQLRKAIPPEQKKEYRKLTTLIARERLFLLSHYLIFLFTNLFGFWMSFKAYHELFYADEVSRTVMALFPLFFINCLALGCLVPIKSTKREITRLKERLTYLHYQIEYVNL